MGAPPPGGRGGFETNNWQFQSNIDPEELFRKIFGDNFRSGGGSFGGDEYAESQFGFGAAQEVRACKVITVWPAIVLLELHSSVQVQQSHLSCKTFHRRK